MSRSKWKGPYTKKKAVQYNLRRVKKISRHQEITPSMLGETVAVHNGLSMSSLDLSSNYMVGRKVGEFVPTRAVFSFKKKKK